MLQEAQLGHGESYITDMEEQFTKAQMKMQRQIESWYQRFADNNQISLTEAKVMLSGRDLKEFKWDVQEYIKYGQLNAVDQKWMKELENASARVHISRLESLKLQMQQQVEVLYGNHLDGADKLMRNIYSEGYYHTAFEIQKGFNVGWDLHKLDENRISKVISKPWTTDNKTFSDRIWGSKRELINQVHTSLTQGIIRGASPNEAISTLAHQMRVKKNQAARLIMTESAFFSSAAQRDTFKDLDVERFEVVATLDSHTSEICQGLDGHVEEMTNFEVGVTAPPFHVWCRSTTVPYFDDNFGERAARGADGKTYYVPADMKYPDWKESFVDGGSKVGMTPIDTGDIIKTLTLEQSIQSVKDKIAANGGVVTEADLKEAGKVVRLELVGKRADFKSQLDAANLELAEFDKLNDLVALDKRINKLRGARRGLYDLSDVGVGSREELDDLIRELGKKNDEIQASRSVIYQRKTEAASKYNGKWKDNAEELRDTIARVRPVGNTSNNMNDHLERSRSPMKQVVTDAYDYYPTEWVDKSVKRGTLTPKKTDRGYYDDLGGEIAISGIHEKSYLETAIHELGHRFERAVPEIRDFEKLFYDRRTAGEDLKWLGSGYKYSERTRFDNFIDSYMGKDYQGIVYELVSMGFQRSFFEPTLMWADEDMCEWIYGILMLL